MQTHLVFVSGGIGSYVTAKRVRGRAGQSGDRLLFLFTDTRSEDKDLYRFLVESVAALTVGPTPDVAECLRLCTLIPDRPCDDYKNSVAAVQERAAGALPQLVWLADGRDLWELFRDKKMIGNTRVDVCSHTLKREIGRKWIEKHLPPDDTTLYFGIDNSERERFYGNGRGKAGIRTRWLPYRAEAPLCDDLYLSKCEMLQECLRDGIEPPRVYEKGYPHNNCASGGGAFCVKGGMAHFLHLLKTDPDVYDYHAGKEQEFRQATGKDVSILRDRTGGVTRPLTMLEFRRQVESGERTVNGRDWGKGCQCFLPEEDYDDREGGRELPGDGVGGGGLPEGEGQPAPAVSG